MKLSNNENLTILNYTLDGRTFRDLVVIYATKNNKSTQWINEQLSKHDGNLKTFCEENNIDGRSMTLPELKQIVSEYITDTGLNGYTEKITGDISVLQTSIVNVQEALDTVDSRIATAIANIVANAPEKFDTLKEIADWIGSDTVGAATLQTDVASLKEDIIKKADKSTTLSGYSITDANISDGVITLGNNSITPLTEHQDITIKADKITSAIANDVVILDSSGNIVDSGMTLGISVPSDAKFTDTITTVTVSGSGNAITEITASDGKLTAIKDITFLVADDIENKADKSTTLSGYGIVDANISDGVITLGNNSITPITDISVKADKIVGGTEGNVITLDASGNIVDSGKTLSISVPVDAKFTDTVTSVSETVSGVGNAITSITATNGVLTVSKDTTFLVSDDIKDKADKSTTLSGYGIVDANISDGVITLGTNTITPITDISGKVDKITSGTEGNVITLDASGNIVDSGKTLGVSVPSDAKFSDTVTTVTTSGSGNAITEITATNGVLTASKGSIFLVTSDINVDETLSKTVSESGKITIGTQYSDTALYHNSIYRGKNLIDENNTKENLISKLSSGDFSNTYTGDYFDMTINDSIVRWIVAGIDVFMNDGDIKTTDHHLVLIPKNCLTNNNIQMNTSDTDSTDGGYISSNVVVNSDTIFSAIDTAFQSFFGENHIMSHRMLFSKTVTNGISSDYEWKDTKFYLPSEVEVFGYKALASSIYDIGNMNRQLPLFALNKESIFGGITYTDGGDTIVKDRYNWWLSSVADTKKFCVVTEYGICSSLSANSNAGIRPIVCLK